MQTKKLLGTTLALSLIVPVAVNATELFKNFKLGGQIDLQATSARNVTDFTTRQPNNGAAGAVGAAAFNDRIGDAQTRIMLNADWDVLDDVHARATLRKSDRNYGTVGGGNANTNGTSQSITAPGGTDLLGNTFVDQAYVKVDKLGGAIDATMGRQFYGTSGDMVVYFGPSDKALYGLPTTSIDAVRADWSNDMVGITGLAGKITGHAVGIAGAVADKDLRGLTATLKGHDTMGVGAYLYNQVTHNTGALGASPTVASAGGKNDNLWVAGLKAKVSMGMAWASAEFAKNFGENRGAFTTNPNLAAVNNAHYTGWAGKIDLGVKADLGGFGSVSPWAHFGYGSGDGANDGRNSNFVAISPDYRPGSIYGRFAVAAGGASIGSATPNAGIATNSLSNRKIWGVGVKTNPAALNKLTAGISYWDYNFAARPQGAPGTPGNGLRHIGSEADLDLTWAHSENVSLGAGVGQFWPGAFIKETIQASGLATAAPSQRGNNPANLGYFDVRVKF